jgi:hypothetical protein
LYGGGLGRLRLFRHPNFTLEASVVTGERSANQVEDDDYVNSAAERLLAGEIGSRRCLGFPQDRLSVEGCSFRVTNLTPVEDVLYLCRDPREDIARVLVLAAQRRPAEWFDWVSARFQRARQLVEAAWPVIEACARSYAQILPRVPERTGTIWGTDLIADLRKSGLRPLDPNRPAVELLKRGESGDYLTWVRRCWRSWGTDPISWRYRAPPLREDRAFAKSCATDAQGSHPKL